MAIYLPGILIYFREGLEVFLIVAIILEFLEKTNNGVLKKFVGIGIMIGATLSVVLAFILSAVSAMLINTESGSVGKLWEATSSLIAVGLIISFIIWIIRQGKNIKKHIEDRTAMYLSSGGIVALTAILVAREGVEMVTLGFAGNYSVISIIIGLVSGIVIATLVFLSLIKVNFRVIFNLTLAYLIIQAGYLGGYGIHEGLSALRGLGYLDGNNILFIQLFDFSQGILNHKEGLVGLPLNVVFGWYSKPEWIQFVVQYLTVASLLLLWFRQNLKK